MSNWWKAVSIWSMLGPPSLFKQRRGKAPERNAALEVCVRWRFGRWKLKSCLNSARCSELSARREKKTLSALKYRERRSARCPQPGGTLGPPSLSPSRQPRAAGGRAARPGMEPPSGTGRAWGGAEAGTAARPEALRGGSGCTQQRVAIRCFEKAPEPFCGSAVPAGPLCLFTAWEGPRGALSVS